MDIRLEQLRAQLESAVAGRSGDQLRRHLPGKWSAAEVLEHLYLTYTITARGLEGVMASGRPDVTKASLKQRVVTFVVLGLGHLPTGRKSPAVAMPKGLSGEHLRSEIGGTLVAMDALIARVEARFGPRKKVLNHPVLGPLSTKQWRTLHVVHGRHHHKQLLELCKP